MTISFFQRHRQSLLLGAILLLGLTLRLAYLYFNMQAPDFESPILDPQLNDYWARALISGDWTPPPHAENPHIAETPYGRPPAYPWLLAGIYFLFRNSYLAPRCIQILVGLVTILLVFLLGKKIFTPKVGIIAAFFMAVFWSPIYFEGELNSPPWEVLVMLSIAVLLLHWTSTSSRYALGSAALFLGLGILMRPNLLLPGLILLLWIFFYSLSKSKKIIHACRQILLFFVVSAAIISPVIIRNYYVAHEFIFVSYYGGINAYIGNNPDSPGTEAKVPDLYEISGVEKWNCFNYPGIVKGLGLSLGEKNFGFSEASHYFYRRAIQFWWEHPFEALKLSLKKAGLFWGPYEISDSKVVHYERSRSPVLAHLPRFSHLLIFIITGLAAWFLFRQERPPRSRGKVLLILLFAAGYFLSILPFFITERYRFPIIPLLLPFAGYAVVWGMGLVLQPSFQKLAALGAIFVFAFVTAFYSPLTYTPNLSTWHLHRGIAFAARGNPKAAQESFLSAISAKPDNDESYVQLGYLSVNAGEIEEAMEYYREALKINPVNFLAANNLGYEYFLQGNYQEAERLYRIAISRQPFFTLTLNNLGNTLLAMGEASGALASFEKALSINPKDPHARYNIANVYLQMRDFNKAIESYERAFEDQPFNPDIANNCGLAFSESGQLEEAIGWLNTALSLDPNYALAHLNLGKIYEDLGQLSTACHHFEAVLNTWPDHEEARQHVEAICVKKEDRSARTD
ncbi:MAG: tetratricopeptide repeat protein [Candidatus Hydrogenedentales bacterium]